MQRNELGLIMVIGFAAAAGAAQDDPTAPERKRLEGTWKVVSSQTSGVTIPKTAYTKVLITFKDDTIEFKDGNKVFQDISYKLDIKAKPKSIDFRHVSGLKKGAREQGIYELQGDQLTLCIAPRGRDRPEEFASVEGDGVQLLKLARVPAKKAN